MKIIVTHASPDLDAVTSVWLIKTFLAGWNEAEVRFVPAGERIAPFDEKKANGPIEHIGDDEVLHVDTGLGPLDHHQTSDDTVCGASRTWDYVRTRVSGKERWEDKEKAIDRMVRVVVAIDHFKEVFWPDADADYQEFSLLGILEGIKMKKANQDNYYVEFVSQCLDAILHTFENRIWAEKEIAENGKPFTGKYGKGIGFETYNDTVLKLAQKMGYILVVRKDPSKGYVRIKARPFQKGKGGRVKGEDKNLNASTLPLNPNIDLTLAYEKLKKMDPEATWFLHVSKKMLLNGTPKNPKMIPTKLSLDEIIKVLESI